MVFRAWTLGVVLAVLAGVELGAQPKLAFVPGKLLASRIVGRAAFDHGITLTSTQGAPAATLSAIDAGTGRPPVWLQHAARVAPGAVMLRLGGAGLAVGVYRAALTAQAPGYAAATCQVELRVRVDDGRKHLLFYGNSYTNFHGGVPWMLSYLVQESGRVAPDVAMMLRNGASLAFHRFDPQHASAIRGGILPGEEWDAVILQGQSLEATSLGDPRAFRDNALGIARSVRAHSKDATIVLFQTWARGPGHAVYPGSFATPLTMHGQIRGNYRAAAADIDRVLGAGAAQVAPVGDCYALHAFHRGLYTHDLSHPSVLGTMHAAQVIFATLYGARACDVQPDFAGSSQLVKHLRTFGVTSYLWAATAGISDRVAARTVRRYPGSGQDLLLTSAVGPNVTAAVLTACPWNPLRRSDRVVLRLASPNGGYGRALAWLCLGWFPTGRPVPPPAAFLHLRVPFSTLTVLATSSGLTANPIEVRTPPVTNVTVGLSAIVQGVVFQAAGGQPVTLTDGHEIPIR